MGDGKSKTEKKPIAVVIGAGPAGLTAAYELLKQTNYHPIVLEESSDIGGISKTINYKGNRIDIGGHRFFSKNEDVMKWWFDFMPSECEKPLEYKGAEDKNISYGNCLNPEKTERVMLLRDRVSRIYYLRKFFDYPLSFKMETILNLGFFNTLNAGIGYLKSVVHKKEEKTLEDFMINRFGEALYKMFFENYTEKVWGRHPSDISASWGAQRIKGLSISKAIVEAFLWPIKKMFGADFGKTETSLIEQFYYPKYGPGQLWETVACEIEKMGGEVLKDTKAQKIIMSHGKAKSVQIKKDGEEFNIECDAVFSSMPIKDLVEGIEEVDVPLEVMSAAKGLPYRDFMMVGLLVNKLEIKNTTKIKTHKNIIPDCWIYIQEPDVKIGRLQIFNNWSPYLVRESDKNIWLGLEYFCNEGDDLWNRPDDEFIEVAIKELEKIGIIDADSVIDSARFKVKKAYPAYFGAYENFEVIRSYLDGFENLFCIGRNGQHRYNNMDHSMLTAFEAVYALKNNCFDKKNIWNVNTEKEYHEAK